MGLKFDLIKYLNSNFAISGTMIFLKISWIVGRSTLYRYPKIQEVLISGKISGKFFSKIGLGGPKPQGVPSKCESLGGIDSGGQGL